MTEDEIKERTAQLEKYLEEREIKFPVQVKEIVFGPETAYKTDDIFPTANVGDWIAIRPCGEEYNNKTYLGIFMGNIALSSSASYSTEQVLTFRYTHHNPAIYVPDLKKIIFGIESFWGKIDSPEKLKHISDFDINNIWYIKALKELSKND